MISLADTCMCLVKPPLLRVVYINLVFASGHGKVVESFNPRDSKGLAANLFISFPVYNKTTDMPREVTVRLVY